MKIGFQISVVSAKNYPPVYFTYCKHINPRGGGTLKFSIYIGEADFFGVKILNFRIFLGFQ